MNILLLVVGWLCLGWVGAGWMFADIMQIFVRSNKIWKGTLYSPEDMERHERQNMGIAIFLGLGGPFMLLVGFWMSGFGQSGWWLWYKGRTL